MFVYARGKLAHALKLDFVRFCIVGGMGFLINLSLLTVLTKVGKLNVFIAQLISAEIALFCNFILHHNWTYKENKVQKTIPSLLIQFHATSWPAIIGSSLMVGAGVSLLRIDKIEALIASSIITLVWNFVWSKYVVWRNVTEKEIEEIAS